MININVVGVGYPLVLFHGWGFDGSIWQGLTRALSPHYQLYCVDLPGFGLTPIQSDEEFIIDLLSMLPLEFSLLGWSMGGLYATKIAHDNPKRVMHLINVTASPYFLSDKDWPGVEKSVFDLFYQKVLANPKVTLDEFLMLQGRKDNIIKYDGVLPSKLALLQGLQRLSTWDLRAYIPTLTCQTHYLFGRLDSIVNRRLMSHISATFKNIHCTQFDKAAHAPFLSHESMFVDYVHSILR